MAAFVDFKYYDSTSDTPAISGLNFGTNADRLCVLANLVTNTVTLNSLTLDGSSMLPADASGSGPGGAWNITGHTKAPSGTGALNIASSQTPAGQLKCVLAASFDGIASVRSVAKVDSGGSPGQPTATVTTVAGDIVVLLGNDLGVYDPTITPGSGATVLTGSGYFIGLMKTASGTSTTINGTFSGSAKNWQGVVFVLTPTGGGTPAGMATETDTALALAGKQIRALGMAIETDTALALVTLAGLPFNTAPYEFGQRTGLDIEDFALYASTALNVSVFAEADVLLASRLFAYTESTGADGRLTRKTHASLTASSWYFFVARNADGSLSGCGRIQAT